MVMAALTILPISIFALLKWYKQEYMQLPVKGGEAHRIADFSLTNQFGEQVTLRNWENKIVVADFFFTHCPVICPKMTKSLKRVQQTYSKEDGLSFNSFSVDPQRDSVGQLQRYAKQMAIHGNWNLLTGDKKIIYSLARKSFLLTATEGDGGAEDFIHSELQVLIDRQKRIRGYYNGTVPDQVDRLVNDIARLLAE